MIVFKNSTGLRNRIGLLIVANGKIQEKPSACCGHIIINRPSGCTKFTQKNMLKVYLIKFHIILK